MGDLFTQYNSQIQVTLENIKNRLRLCKETQSGPNHVLYLNELDNFLSSAEETLRQMELEARSFSDSSSFDRLDQVNKIRSFLKDASDLSRSLHTELQRKELLGEVSSFGNTREFKTLAKNREMLDKGLMFVKASVDVVNEAEKMGYDASKNLSSQRQVITNLGSELRRAKLSLSTADDYLSSLLKQGRLNRVVLNVVKIAILVTFIIVIMSRLIKFALSYSK